MIISAKEKANELIDLFYPIFLNSVRNSLVKQSVFITIDELVKQEQKLLGYQDVEGYSSEYWEEVKKEVEKEISRL